VSYSASGFRHYITPDAAGVSPTRKVFRRFAVPPLALVVIWPWSRHLREVPAPMESQAAQLSPPPLTVFLEPVGYHVGKAIVPEVSPVNDAKSPIVTPVGIANPSTR
jgi:hypothetical protein